MAVTRVAIGGWRQETDDALTRVTINGWRQEVTGAAAGGNTTVSPSSGSLQFSGPAYLKRAERTISAGSIQFQGQTLTLQKLKDIVLSSGSLQFSGQTLARELRKALGAGSIQFQGQTLTLEKLLSLSLSAGSLQFSGQALSRRFQKGISSASLQFQGPAFTTRQDIPGLTTVTFSSGSIRFTGQTLQQRVEFLISSGTLRFQGQALTLEKTRLIPFSSGAVQFQGQTFTLGAMNTIRSIDSGVIQFSGQTFTVVGAASSSGVRRLQHSEYIHALFAGDTIAQLVRRELEEPLRETPAGVIEQLLAIEAEKREELRQVEDEIEALEDGIVEMEGRVRTQEKLRVSMQVQEARRAEAQRILYRITWYLNLLEEDEIILLALQL